MLLLVSYFLNSASKAYYLDKKGTPFLLRIVKKSQLGKEVSSTEFFESITLQKGLDHPHIAKIHELFEDEGSYYLIYE